MRLTNIKDEEIMEMRTILRARFPLGNETSQCHLGICTIRECMRCQDAARIWYLVNNIIPEL